MAYSREREIELFQMSCEDLKQIHKIKSATYGPSWRKRGELVSIFGNVARKFDRLEKIASDPKLWQEAMEGGLNEQIEDTVIDLAVYSVLWCTFLREEREESYTSAVNRAVGN